MSLIVLFSVCPWTCCWSPFPIVLFATRVCYVLFDCWSIFSFSVSCSVIFRCGWLHGDDFIHARDGIVVTKGAHECRPIHGVEPFRKHAHLGGPQRHHQVLAGKREKERDSCLVQREWERKAREREWQREGEREARERHAQGQTEKGGNERINADCTSPDWPSTHTRLRQRCNPSRIWCSPALTSTLTGLRKGDNPTQEVAWLLLAAWSSHLRT